MHLFLLLGFLVSFCVSSTCAVSSPLFRPFPTFYSKRPLFGCVTRVLFFLVCSPSCCSSYAFPFSSFSSPPDTATSAYYAFFVSFCLASLFLSHPPFLPLRLLLSSLRDSLSLSFSLLFGLCFASFFLFFMVCCLSSPTPSPSLGCTRAPL